MNEYYMFHKPRGCITARRDPRKKTVMDYFPEDKRDVIFPVGRLDKETEGKKHQVRRMLAYAGTRVIYLKRVKIGELSLDENLKAGEYRELTQFETEQILSNDL